MRPTNDITNTIQLSKQDLNEILTHSDLEAVNAWILRYQSFEPLDEFEERFKRVYDAIIALEPLDRLIWVCYILNNYKIKDTAAQLKVSTVTISKYIKKIKAVLCLVY